MDGFYIQSMKNTQEINTLYHSIFQIHFHLVLVTKYRKKCITQPMLHRLEEIFSQLCIRWECELKEFNGEADHVHLLIASNPKVQPTKLINNFKTVSARYLRKEYQQHLKQFYWKPTFWSRSYCLLSCGGAPLSIIKQYIQQQDEIS